MTRSAARRHGVVPADKSLPPVPPAFEHDPDDPYAVPTATTPWYWRFVMFLWLTSFIFLLAYEWLAGILKSWGGS